MKEETLRLILQSEHGAEAFSKWIEYQYAALIVKTLSILFLVVAVIYVVRKFATGEWGDFG